MQPERNGYAAAIREAARPLHGTPEDYDDLLELVADSRVVLLGESTHGTHEFYRERARITSRLVSELEFDAVAVEADWPDAYRVDRYVRGRGGDAGADEALSSFKRFPAWMWRNREVLDFVAWLRSYNDFHAHQAGFYGLDLYSLYSSIEAVLGYLWNTDGEAHARARERYACFGGVRDPQEYAYQTGYGGGSSCEDAAVAQLLDLQRQALEDVEGDEEGHFAAEQNARLVVNAERYYRTMFRAHVSSWNMRDRHMADTLLAIDERLTAQLDRPAKIVVWAHNSHVGDARATQMGEQGELNIGQLARAMYGRLAFNVGFTTYTGTVTAASSWDSPSELKRVLPAAPESYEGFFHVLGPERFWLPLKGRRDLVPPRLLERAIGVLYLPQNERQNHYFTADLAHQFDAVVHIDETEALTPLEPGELWHPGEEVPETFPFAADTGF